MEKELTATLGKFVDGLSDEHFSVLQNKVSASAKSRYKAAASMDDIKPGQTPEQRKAVWAEIQRVFSGK